MAYHERSRLLPAAIADNREAATTGRGVGTFTEQCKDVSTPSFSFVYTSFVRCFGNNSAPTQLQSFISVR